jgi:hypothetical protein
VDAQSTADAFARANGGSGALGISVSLFESTATVGRSLDTDPKVLVQASIGEAADVEAGDLTVEASASNDARAELFSIGIALVGGGAGGRGTARVDQDVKAFVGPEGARASTTLTTLDVDGDIRIAATTAQLANADIDGGGGGIVGGGSLNVTATSQGATSAFVGEATDIEHANNLAVLATVNESRANAESVVGTGGVVSVGVVTVTANSAPKISAYIGPDVQANIAAAGCRIRLPATCSIAPAPSSTATCSSRRSAGPRPTAMPRSPGAAGSRSGCPTRRRT